jgi:pilus assembly protein CpaE
MALPLRVCLYNQSGDIGGAFRAAFESAGGLNIMAECANWQALQEYLLSSRVDVIIIDLDTCPPPGSHAIMQHIAEVAPHAGILGVSRTADPDMIISAMRAGCSQFVRWPIVPADLRAALDRMRRANPHAALNSHRVCVVGCGGGAGATTVASNLALELAQATGTRCALVDMDLQFGNLACAFDSSPRYSVADVCRHGADIDRALLEDALDNLPCNVSILACPQQFDVSADVPPDRVEQMFRILGQMFPFVVTDVPRYFIPTNLAALSTADRILLIMQVSVPHLRNAVRIFKGLLQVGVSDSRIGLVLNRCKANFENIKREEVEKHFGRPIFASIPNDYRRMGASRDLGHPLKTDAPNSPARVAIQEIARQLAADYLGNGEAEAQTAQPRGGIMSLFRRTTKARPTA